MEAVRMSNVVVDAEKNRLNITVTGAICKEEMEKIYRDLHVCVPELTPGFSVVTDLTRCKVGHLSGLPTLKHIMEYLIENKVGKIVRVVGKAKIVFNQISRITEHLQGYKVVYVATLQEAEEALNQSQ
jgi:hypothetical protein